MLSLTASSLSAFQPAAAPRAAVAARSATVTMEGKGDEFTLAILGDLHLDPRDLDHSYEGRDHMNTLLEGAPNPFVVSLGDLGESKDCTQTQQLFSGTSECFKLCRDFLDGFNAPFDVAGGNHDLEVIDEFATDEENLEAYLKGLGKE